MIQIRTGPVAAVPPLLVATSLAAMLLAGCSADVKLGDQPAPGCQPYTRTELFLGTTRPGGAVVSESEFDAFLDAEITPRFPDGLTMLTGRGQFRGVDGRLVQERSVVVVLLYPRSSGADSGAKVDQIRELYKQKFSQESVLRSDDADPACVSF